MDSGRGGAQATHTGASLYPRSIGSSAAATAAATRLRAVGHVDSSSKQRHEMMHFTISNGAAAAVGFESDDVPTSLPGEPAAAEVAAATRAAAAQDASSAAAASTPIPAAAAAATTTAPIPIPTAFLGRSRLSRISAPCFDAADDLQQHQQQLLAAAGDMSPSARLASSLSGAGSPAGSSNLRSALAAGVSRSAGGPPQLPLLALATAAAAAGRGGPGSFSGSGAGGWMQQEFFSAGDGSVPGSPYAFQRSDSPCSVSFSGLEGGEGCPGQILRLHCATFNMSSKSLGQPLPPSLLGLDTKQQQLMMMLPDEEGDDGRLSSSGRGNTGSGAPDLLAFATQETYSVTEWEKLVGEALGPDYCRLGSVSLRVITLGLWGRRSLRRHVRQLKASSVATGIGNVVGNKGGVALSLQLGELKLLFIGAHFAAHDDQVARRNADFHAIRTGLFASGALTAAAPAATGLHTPTLSGSPALMQAAAAAAAAGGGGGSGGGGMFRVGSGLILPPPTPGGASTPTVGWPVGGRAAWDTEPARSGSAAVLSAPPQPAPGEGLAAETLSASGGAGGDEKPGVSEPSQQPPQKRAGFWQRLRSGGGGGADSGSDGHATSSKGTGSGLFSRPHRGHKVAPVPPGFEDSSDDDERLLGVHPRAASCPPGALRPTLVTPAGAAAATGGWHLAASASTGAGEQVDAAEGSQSAQVVARSGLSASFPRYHTLPRSATSGALAALASRSEAGAGGGGSSALASRLGSRRPSFLFGGKGSGSGPAPRRPDAPELHDAVFWMGDLNYRINGGSRVVSYLLRSPLFQEVLHANDQLQLQQKRGAAFQVRCCWVMWV